MKQYTNTSAMAHFGAKLKNTRWGWCGISDDNSVVAVIIWLDHAKTLEKGKLFFDGFEKKHQDTIGYWGDRIGNNDRKVKLKHAIKNLDGLVRVVIAKAVDKSSKKRTVERVYPLEKKWFKINRFDEETGQFSLIYSHEDV